MPTPAVAYLTRALRLQAGVVISASHNPFEDNGIKFFSASGEKLPDSVEEAIEARLDRPIKTVEARQLGRARRIEDAAARYIEFCKSTFPESPRPQGHAHRGGLRQWRDLPLRRTCCTNLGPR
jgi:phosphoglucosamine mutase